MRDWLRLTGPDFERLNKRLAVLPVGSVERHGDHLPLGTDVLIPEWIAREVVKRIEGAILLPTIPYGSSKTLSRFPGTIDVNADAFRKYVESVLVEIARNGFKVILIINGHGGNTTALQFAAKEAAFRTNAAIVVINWWLDVAQDRRLELFPKESWGHAGADETAAMMHIAPETVRMELARSNPKPYPKVRLYYRRFEEEVLFPIPLTGIPKEATPEKGKEFLEAVVDEIVRIANDVIEKVSEL